MVTGVGHITTVFAELAGLGVVIFLAGIVDMTGVGNPDVVSGWNSRPLGAPAVELAWTQAVGRRVAVAEPPLFVAFPASKLCCVVRDLAPRTSSAWWRAWWRALFPL